MRKGRRVVTGALWMCIWLTLGHGGGAFAAPGDEHWDTQFGWPGVPEVVVALWSDAETVYTGGLTFNMAPSAIRVYSPASGWSVLGTVSGEMALVEEIVEFRSDLWAGGIFTHVDGIAATGLARWDGVAWSAVVGFEGAVLGMTTDGTNLYVAGAFTNVGSEAATNVARWDGEQWHRMGDGLGEADLSEFDAVYELLWHNGTLYACGDFAVSGTATVRRLAKWDGSAWLEVGGGLSSLAYAMAADGSDLYVGGAFQQAGGVTVNRIARWDGAAWSPLGGGADNAIHSLCLFNGALYAAGHYDSMDGIPHLARWTGSAWESVGLPNDSALALHPVGGRLVVGGLFTQVDDRIMGAVGAFDGATWSTLGDGLGAGFIVLDVVAAPDGVYAGGTFSAAGETAANRIARWNGQAWTPLGTGITSVPGTVRAISVRDAGPVVFAGGTFTEAGGVPAANIAQWNGTAWAPLGSGANNSVYALAATATGLYAGGSFSQAGGVPASRIAYWNGANWTGLGSGVNDNVLAIAVDGTNVYAGGVFTTAGGIAANRIARWDGSQWVSLGAGAANGLNNSVRQIVVAGSNVYVCGSFTTAGGVPAAGVARWDGAAWSAMATSLTGRSKQIDDLVLLQGHLYAGGSFTEIDGTSASSVARWSGTEWQALGSGVRYTASDSTTRAYALAAAGDDLFVGGIFQTAGDKRSLFFGRWNEQIDFDLQPSIQLGLPWLTPDGHLAFRVTTTGLVSSVVEWSTNATDWIPAQTNQGTTFEFSDPLGDYKLYRVHGL